MKEGAWNPSRVLAALGKIGYHPVSAILDIVDNSVSAGASKVDVRVNAIQEKQQGKGRKKSVIESISIVDNGCGMDESGIENAVSLGSSEKYYHEGTLSKFGMGLKSAASSLGGRLEIISFTEKNKPLKVILDHDLIEKEERYVYELTEPSQDEMEIFESLGENDQKSGTIVRISKVHLESMPSVAEILTGLQKRAGIVYYFYLRGSVEGHPGLRMYVNEEEISAFDPLFVDEIDGETGNLEEHSWKGLDVKWILMPQKIQLDASGKKLADVTITQLPHPPSVADAEKMTQKACRDKYMIGSGNYGFYIYRNGRLISWADSLEMVGQDQNLYSFRGRLEIGSDSDEVLNIDVTKSRIHLSEMAKDQIIPLVQEAKKKSITAWITAGSILSNKVGEDPHNEIGDQLDKIADILEKDDAIDEEVASKEEQLKLRDRREKARNVKEATEEEKERLEKQGQRVQYVSTLDNNQLWERALDPERGLIVRVNQSHRVYKELIEAQHTNSELIKVIDVLFFSLARGEYGVVYKSDFDQELVEQIMDDYRERVGNDLSEIVKKIEIN